MCLTVRSALAAGIPNVRKKIRALLIGPQRNSGLHGRQSAYVVAELSQ